VSLESWKTAFEIAGVILLGLTFLSGAGVLITSNRLNARQAERLRQFDKDLTGAKTELGQQQERAAKESGKVAGLQKDAADAKTAQQRVETELAKQRERTANAEKAASDAALALANFKAPRVISAGAQKAMIGELSFFAGTPFDLSVGSDSESIKLMEVVQSVLVAAKWKQVAAVGPIGVSGTNPLVSIAMESGIHVEIHETRRSDWERAAHTLSTLIKREGISVEGHAAPDTTSNAIHVIIGTKPRD
jgi:hypothetical protein